MKKQVFLIHGLGDDGSMHWFPWLAGELKARGFEVCAPTMPHTGTPKLSEWLTFLKGYVGRPGRNSYFVGHSLGCISIVRYLASLTSDVQIGGSVFVAGSVGDNNPEIAEFYETPFDIERAKDHCKNFVTIFSDNDPEVSLDRGIEFQRALGARLIIEKGKGHFCADDGVTSLPNAFSSIIKMSS